MNKEKAIQGLTNIFLYALASIQTNEILQWIEFGLAILSTLFLLFYRIRVWRREVMKDGKIDKEELKQGIEILKEGVTELKETIDSKKEERSKHD